MAQRDLPFSEPEQEQGQCRDCGGPTRFIGRLKTESLYKCTHCGARQGTQSPCRLGDKNVDSAKPHESGATDPARPVASVNRLCVSTGEVRHHAPTETVRHETSG
jgi:hypothetical protein